MDIRQKLLTLLNASDYIPMREEEVLTSLKLGEDQMKRAARILAEMCATGEIARIEKNRLCISREADLVSGQIHFRQSGSAFVIPQSEKSKKNRRGYPVAAEDTGVALHGDQVLARIKEQSKRKSSKPSRSTDSSEEKPNVQIIRILERASDTIVGNLEKSRHTWFVIPDDPRIIPDFLVIDPKKSHLKPVPKLGDKVIVKMTEWRQRHLKPEGEIIEVLGRTHEPDAEFRGILFKYELNPEFPMAVQRQAAEIPDHVQATDRKGRQDCRDIFTFTIDPDDAKDFDDALSLQELDDDHVRVGIHIADVAAYVNPDTPLDKEARKRGNSTYLVGTVIPMLPHALSNGLCSLVEAEDRLTKSVFITYAPDATVKKVEYANTVIRSNKRLTYKQAHAFMFKDDFDEIRQTPLPPKHQIGSTGKSLNEVSCDEMNLLKVHIRKLWSIAEQLRRNRFRKGSLDLDMTEIKIYTDEQGHADRIEKSENDESHQLIEEFMLSANEQVARIMKRNRLPCLYRVHDEPEDEKLQELRETMNSFGVKCGHLRKASEMSKLLKALKNHPQGYTLKIHVLRSLKQAQYRASPDGHYGLAKPDYTHFTSPIRRYSDLVVHRIFDGYLYKNGIDSTSATPGMRYSQAKLESIGEHLCVTERNSIDAERESVKIKLLEFYERELEKERKQPFDAVVTDIKNHGLYIEVTDTMAFGMVHISTLDDFYSLAGDGRTLIGRRRRKTYSIGQHVRIQVERVDRFKRQIDFRIVPEKETGGRKAKSHRGKSLQGRPPRQVKTSDSRQCSKGSSRNTRKRRRTGRNSETGKRA